MEGPEVSKVLSTFEFSYPPGYEERLTTQLLESRVRTQELLECQRFTGCCFSLSPSYLVSLCARFQRDGAPTQSLHERRPNKTQTASPGSYECPGRDSNPYDRFQSEGFKPSASAIPPPRLVRWPQPTRRTPTTARRIPHQRRRGHRRRWPPIHSGPRR